ncbi:cell adhesion molecule-related/down-regulated by oncogenes-like [Sinocyclocheilus grahami]|uniref:cell adhesion molecule-related/down-regulated by oncogenes-like n=1 Tax=Sinocyclocheilus grahami TaxID=75366 RepID=UPI0007ACBAB4|nr:PREDICTED: cell adhesion molecule-related/down-regulated by oncogenes-like [Sinocyclocheilus grahami]
MNEYSSLLQSSRKCLILIALFCFLHSDIERFAETHRRTFTVNKGETAVIECPLPRSNPSALPRFRIRGKWLEQSTDEYLILPSGNLQIVSVFSEHQGMYKCGAYNPLTRETQVEAHGTKLMVRDSEGPSPIRIVYPVTPRNLTVDQSGSLTLECVISGSRSSKVKWIKDGAELSLNSKWMLLQSNLVLHDVQLSDGGHYCCSVLTDRGAVVSVIYTVNVLAQVSVLQGLSDQSVTVGSSVRFTCTASGSPTPNITWLLNSTPLASSPRLQIAGPSLHISSVMVQDQGIYQCLFDNGISSAQSAGRLSVQSEPQASSMSGALMETQPSVYPIQSDESDELFPSIGEEGIGETIGTPTERISDKATPEAPIIISPPQTHKPNMYDLEWRAGRDWGIPINAYFVKYRKVDDMGNVVGNWHTVRVPGSEKSLPLSELEPSSLYEVLMVARSAAGQGQPAMLTFRTGKERTSSNKNPSKAPIVSLPEKALEDKTTNTYYGVVIHDRVPEAPDRPTISMATESSVYVAWIPRANGGSPITAFRVEYRKQGRSGDWIIAADNISPLKLSVEVRNLEPGTTYRFRVIAMNNYGESPASATSRPYQVSLSSPPVSNRPITGPHISSTDAVSDTQIMLRWTVSTLRDVVEGFKFWHLIGQLQPETSYDIKMQCFNDGGESEYSNVMICETKEYDPPSYLYHSAEMNGHVLEYSTLPGSSHVNGSVHTGCGHSAPMMPQACHHLHHKLPNGLALLNGSGGLYPLGHPHAHDASLPHNTTEYDHSHPHHLHNVMETKSTLEHQRGVQPVQHEDSEGPVVCWEQLGLPDLDCKEKTAWISTGNLNGDLIQPTVQEI